MKEITLKFENDLIVEFFEKINEYDENKMASVIKIMAMNLINEYLTLDEKLSSKEKLLLSEAVAKESIIANEVIGNFKEAEKLKKVLALMELTRDIGLF